MRLLLVQSCCGQPTRQRGHNNDRVWDGRAAGGDFRDGWHGKSTGCAPGSLVATCMGVQGCPAAAAHAGGVCADGEKAEAGLWATTVGDPGCCGSGGFLGRRYGRSARITGRRRRGACVMGGHGLAPWSSGRRCSASIGFRGRRLGRRRPPWLGAEDQGAVGEQRR
jgi:hypothetical protein